MCIAACACTINASIRGKLNEAPYSIVVPWLNLTWKTLCDAEASQDHSSGCVLNGTRYTRAVPFETKYKAFMVHIYYGSLKPEPNTVNSYDDYERLTSES